MAGAGVALAPAAASQETGQVSDQQVESSTATFGGGPDFTVEAEDTEAEPGERTTVDVNIEPTADSGLFDFFIPDNQRIDWFELRVEYDAEKLDFEGASSEIGSIDVVDETPGSDTGTLVIENGYEFGDFFLNPSSAPATLASLEFTVTGEGGDEAEVTPTEDSKVGYGPDFLKHLPVFQHDVEYEGGVVEITGDDGGEDPAPTNTFTATNPGGFISFGEGDEQSAREEGIDFPEDGITIEGEINDDGTWESTDVSFEPLSVTGGLEADVEAPDGLSGEIDIENDVLTAEGELIVSVAGSSFSFTIAPTTGDSGALSGSADLTEDGGTATLVDNEYIIDDTTGSPLVDPVLGLPITEPGQNWLELPLEIDADIGDGGGGEPDPEPPETTTLSAVNSGGFISFGENTESDARAEGIDFPNEGIEIEGELSDDGTWESTSVDFEPLSVTGGLQADVEAPNGLSGEYDIENDFLTAEGQLTVTVSGSSFSFTIAPTTGDSGALSGSADLSEDGGSATLVDNEYIVDDTTGSPLIDPVLGLPITEPGQSWLELPLDITIDGDVGGEEDGTLAVSVEDQNGDAIEGADVSVDGESAQTDANGEASFELAPGTYDVTAETEGETAEATVDVAAGETTEQTLTLAIADEDELSFNDQQLQDGAVTVENVTTGQPSTVVVTYTDGDQEVVAGVAPADNLDSEDVQVTIEDTGGFPGEHTAWVFDDEDLPADLGIGDDANPVADSALDSETAVVSASTGTLAVSVTDAEGAAIEGADVSVDDESAQTDANGEASFELAPGDYEVTASASGASATESVTVEADAPTEVALTLETEPPSDLPDNFTATNTGDGFISFDESTLDDAIAEGIAFPQDGITIEGEISDDGTWESTTAEFPTLVPREGLQADASAPNGLSGEIDVENDYLSSEGTLRVEVLLDGQENPSFSFDIDADTGVSNGSASPQGLVGSADLSQDGGTATVVDNEYTVEDETGNPIVDPVLGLPIEDPGLAWLELSLEIDAQSGDDPEPEPPANGTLAVSVDDQDGEAVEGATVEVDGQSAQTDANGEASFELAPDDYDVTVTTDNDQASTQVTVEEGATTEATLQVDAPTTGMLEVTVEDQNGAAIEGATVTVDGASAQTDASGTASFTLESGTYTVTAEAEGASDSTDVTLEAGGNSQVSIQLDVGDGGGGELPDSFTATNTGDGFISFNEDNLDDAIAEGIAFPENGITIEGEISDDGTWESTTAEFPTLVPQEGLEADASAPNGLSGEIDVENDFLSSQGTLQVTLVSTGDSFSFDINAVSTESNGAASDQGLTGSADLSQDGGTATVVDNEYTVEDETGSPIVDPVLGLPIEDSGLAWLELSLEIDAQSGGDDPEPPANGTLAVSVEDQDGEVVEGATVEVDGQSATTDANGEASFDLAPGDYDVTVTTDNDQASTQVTVEEDATTDTTVQVDVPKTGTLVVSVTDQNGDAIDGATVSVPDQEVTTGSSGQAEFELDAGTYQVTVSADGEEATTEVDVQADATTEATVTFEQTGTLALTVQDQDGEAVEGATVEVDDHSAQTDANGEVSFELAPGTYDVSVTGEDDQATITADVTANAVTERSVELEVIKTGTLVVSVVDQEGGAIEGAAVGVDGESATTDGSGEASFELEADSYSVSAEAEGESDAAEVTVQADSTQTVSLELPVLPETPSTFEATNTGGFIAFDESNEQDARSNGVNFPEGGITIFGEVNDDGTWESTTAEFPVLEPAAEIEANAEAPNGLSGELDLRENSLTAQGTLSVTVLVEGQPSFSFDIGATTGQSGALEGSADLTEQGGTATVVDNEFTVNDTTGDMITDATLGLPITESGLAWLELPLNTTFDVDSEPVQDGTLVMSVVDQDGEAVEGATVEVDGESAQTDASGEASFELAPGSYEVTVTAASDQASTVVGIEEDATTEASVEVQVEKTGTLAVSVTDQDGEAVEGASVSVDGQSAQTDANGEATFELAPGDYEVTAESGGSSASADVTVETDTTTQADLSLNIGPDLPDSFTATNTGDGFISFNEDTLSSALSEGINFSENDITIEGEISDDGTWESTTAEFPVLVPREGLQADASAPDGLSGEIDVENNFLSAQGTLNVTILTPEEPSFEFQFQATSEDSNGAASPQGLTGSADLSADGGTATIVDNEYTVPDETGNPIVDPVLGLPIEEPGLAWLELSLEIDAQSSN